MMYPFQAAAGLAVRRKQLIRQYPLTLGMIIDKGVKGISFQNSNKNQFA